MNRLYSCIGFSKIAILLLYVVVSSVSCKSSRTSDHHTLQRIGVPVESPLVESITLTSKFPGYVSADRAVDLVGRVNGYLKSINYSPGEYVQRGKVLFVIEPVTYINAVNQAKAQLESAQAALDYAKNNYSRVKEAAASNAVSEIDVIQSKTDMQSAEANLESAKSALSTAQVTLSYCYVKAPGDGKVSVSIYGVGTYIAGAGSPVKLATIYEDSKVFINFNIPDTYLSVLQNLDSLTASMDESLNGKEMIPLSTFKGKIDYISPSINLSTGTMTMRAVVENKDGILRDGLYVNVLLPYLKTSNTVLIKNVAVGTDQAGQYVYLVTQSDDEKGSVAKYTHITTGPIINDSLVVVSSGLKKDDLYITGGLMKVRDGMPVNPVKR